MLTKLTHITLFVNNQKEALDFYVNKLGFIVHTDAMFDKDLRWLTITPSSQKEIEIALLLADSDEEKALVGKQASKKPFLSFSCEDCQKTFAALKNNGVKIVSEPETQPWGISMSIEDLYGNSLYIVQEIN